MAIELPQGHCTGPFLIRL